MKIVGILLLIFGVAGIGLGSIMYGDIGIACIVGDLAALLSGIGFLMTSGEIKKLKNQGI